MEIAAAGYLRRFNETVYKAPVVNYDDEDENKKVVGGGKGERDGDYNTISMEKIGGKGASPWNHNIKL